MDMLKTLGAIGSEEEWNLGLPKTLLPQGVEVVGVIIQEVAVVVVVREVEVVEHIHIPHIFQERQHSTRRALSNEGREV
jgi:hypothetical protein